MDEDYNDTKEGIVEVETHGYEEKEAIMPDMERSVDNTFVGGGGSSMMGGQLLPLLLGFLLSRGFGQNDAQNMAALIASQTNDIDKGIQLLGNQLGTTLQLINGQVNEVSRDVVAGTGAILGALKDGTYATSLQMGSGFNALSREHCEDTHQINSNIFAGFTATGDKITNTAFALTNQNSELRFQMERGFCDTNRNVETQADRILKQMSDDKFAALLAENADLKADKRALASGEFPLSGGTVFAQRPHCSEKQDIDVNLITTIVQNAIGANNVQVASAFNELKDLISKKG